MIFKEWLNLNPENIPVNMPLSERIIDYIKLGTRVLDIGCGLGRLCNFFESKNCIYTGIDVNRLAIEAAKRKFYNKKAAFQVGTVEKTHFPNTSFDMLIAQGTLACLDFEGRANAIAEMRRIGKEGAVLHITELDLLGDKAYYQTQMPETGEYGTVLARQDGTSFGYTTHHFSRQELLKLLGKDWKVLIEEHPILTTKNCNQYPSHRFIARRCSYGHSG